MPQVEANGISIEVEEFGDSADPTMLLIMGLGAQMIAWSEDFCGLLAGAGHHVVRFDNRDVGLSTWFDEAGEPDMVALFGAAMAGQPVEAPYSLSDMADDAVGVLDALGIDAAHIVGASMGGMIAQRVAINHPGRTSSLCSIMSMPRFIPGDPEVTGALMGDDPGTREGRIAMGIEGAHLLSGGAFPIDGALLREFVEVTVDRAWHPEGTARQMAAIIADGDRTEGLRGVASPTVVIHGTADRLVLPEGGEETAAAVDGAELVWVEGMGHEIPPGAQNQVVDAMSRLVARTGG
ncbi:MAG: alpha/beta hydrolase [Actinobacteria bacterium]|nr:alpha/beta hydrolase [Actinomycetota bacterium]